MAAVLAIILFLHLTNAVPHGSFLASRIFSSGVCLICLRALGNAAAATPPPSLFVPSPKFITYLYPQKIEKFKANIVNLTLNKMNVQNDNYKTSYHVYLVIITEHI